MLVWVGNHSDEYYDRIWRGTQTKTCHVWLETHANASRDFCNCQTRCSGQVCPFISTVQRLTQSNISHGLIQVSIAFMLHLHKTSRSMVRTNDFFMFFHSIHVTSHFVFVFLKSVQLHIKYSTPCYNINKLYILLNTLFLFSLRKSKYMRFISVNSYALWFL